MKKIGYLRNRYPEIRNIINRGCPENSYLFIAKIRFALLMLSRASEIMVGKVIRKSIPMNNDLHAIYRPVTAPKVDIIHTFNTVCNTTIPWVSTFETMIPRTNYLCGKEWKSGALKPNSITQKGFKLLEQDSCKALIALSEANKKIQLQIMDTLNIENRDIIAGKITVLHPPQPVLISHEEIDTKFENINSCIEFIFVGGLFYRKGGGQMLDAMQKMVSSGMPVHLTVISSLVDDGFAHVSSEDKARYEKMLANSDWITHYHRLPNAEVLELCKKAHIGILPSMADTYGYSILEMMSCGCSIISTDIRAMPEINNDDCGFMIHVPKHPSTEAKYDTVQELETLKQTIFEQICSILECIQENPAQVKEKAHASVNKIAKDHDPDAFSRTLQEIYEKV